MTAYILRRLLGVLAVVAAMTVLIFAIVHILNDPLPLQYWHWVAGALQGDLGQSLTMDRPAAPLILDALGRSAVMAGLAFAIVAAAGIGLGVYGASREGTARDHAIATVQLLFIAVPDYFWAILAVLLFASLLGWLPATGYAPLADGFGPWAAHLVLPVAVLAIGLVAHVSRLTRASMLEALRSRYVLFARAKGLSERRVLWRHAAPNALLPAITVLAIDFGLLIGGVVVIETVFAYPGLGRLLIYAIERHDLPLLQAGMLVLTTIYALANLLADLLYAALNPRIRHATGVA